MSENISEKDEKDIATIANEIATGMQKGRDSRTAMNHGPWRPDRDRFPRTMHKEVTKMAKNVCERERSYVFICIRNNIF